MQPSITFCLQTVKALSRLHECRGLSFCWLLVGAQLLSGRVLDSRQRGRGFEPPRRHCVVSLSRNINPSLVLVQPRKTCPFITERLLMGRKELNESNSQHDIKVPKYLMCDSYFQFKGMILPIV